MNRLSWINVIAGIWLIISPWVLGFQGIRAATWSAVISGIVVGVVALASYFVPGVTPARSREPYRP